jgi:hypothetical protein
MERFTSEFLTTDDPAEALWLAEQWIDPGITLHFAGTEQHGRESIWPGRVQSRDIPGPRLDR